MRRRAQAMTKLYRAHDASDCWVIVLKRHHWRKFSYFYSLRFIWREQRVHLRVNWSAAQILKNYDLFAAIFSWPAELHWGKWKFWIERFNALSIALLEIMSTLFKAKANENINLYCYGAHFAKARNLEIELFVCNTQFKKRISVDLCFGVHV